MASRLQDVLLRGLAAAKPLATTVANGTLYYSTDTFVTEQSDGTIWHSYTDATSGPPSAHAPSHAAAGSDPVNLLALAGFPGGTDFLRADGIFAPTPAAPTRFGMIAFPIDGAGVVITTGIKGFIPIPFACTILGWTLLSTDPATLAGSIVIDIWKAAFGSYPPTVADTITAAAKPTLTAANKATGSPTGWNVNIAAGDVLGYKVDSASTVTRVTLTLSLQLV